MSGHVIFKAFRVRPTQRCGAQVIMGILKHRIEAEAKRREHVCRPNTNGSTVRAANSYVNGKWERNLCLLGFTTLQPGLKRRLE
jgi:hypothetical protein